MSLHMFHRVSRFKRSSRVEDNVQQLLIRYRLLKLVVDRLYPLNYYLKSPCHHFINLILLFVIFLRRDKKMLFFSLDKIDIRPSAYFHGYNNVSRTFNILWIMFKIIASFNITPIRQVMHVCESWYLLTSGKHVHDRVLMA
jgi:hypothetical protein